MNFQKNQDSANRPVPYKDIEKKRLDDLKRIITEQNNALFIKNKKIKDLNADLLELKKHCASIQSKTDKKEKEDGIGDNFFKNKYMKANERLVKKLDELDQVKKQLEKVMAELNKKNIKASSSSHVQKKTKLEKTLTSLMDNMYGMLGITINFKGTKRVMQISKHAIEKLIERKLIDPDLNFFNMIQKTISNSILILKKPVHVLNLMRNDFNDSVYMYAPHDKIIYVVEEDRDTGEYNRIVTAYSSESSAWIEKWKNRNPVHERIATADYFESKPNMRITN